MIRPITIEWGGKRVDFQMELDENYYSDYAVLQHINNSQPCEPEVCYMMLRAVREGDTVVDGGANVGFFTLLLSRLVGPRGTVFAFEPGENNLQRLRQNLVVNDCKNVVLSDQPLWSEETEVPFFTRGDGGENSCWWVQEMPGEMASVRTTTLDSYLSRGPVRLIKLDIEGAEFRALQGAKRMLRNSPVIIAEMNEPALLRAGASINEIRSLLKWYECFMLSPLGQFPVYVPREIDIKPVRRNTNVMFARRHHLREMWTEVHL